MFSWKTSVDENRMGDESQQLQWRDFGMDSKNQTPKNRIVKHKISLA
jgi:hypothetical protein